MEVKALLEINANGKKIMTINDNNETLVHDLKVAKEIDTLSDKDMQPSYTIIEG